MTLVTLPGGETIWYKVTGAKDSGAEPLLQIHGSAFGHRNFSHLTPLCARDYAVIDFDLPGYGESRGEARPGGMQGIADMVAELIEALPYERVNIHGTSFGAMIGLTLAASHPQLVDRLVLSCFLAKYDNAARMMRATWKRCAREMGMAAVADLTSVAGFARGFYDRADTEEILESIRVANSNTLPEAFCAGTEVIEATDLSPLLPKISMPVLLLAGAEDNMTAFDTAPSGFGLRRISEALAGAELHVIPESGHYLVIEQPEVVAEKIRGFLG